MLGMCAQARLRGLGPVALLLAAMLLSIAALSTAAQHEAEEEEGEVVVAKHSLMTDTPSHAAMPPHEADPAPQGQGGGTWGCRRTGWEGFTTSGLLCQAGVNGRCRYRVPIGRALTLGADTLIVSFANAATAPAPPSEPPRPDDEVEEEVEGTRTVVREEEVEAQARRHTVVLTAEQPVHRSRSDERMSPLAKAVRPLVRLMGTVRRALFPEQANGDGDGDGDGHHADGRAMPPEPVMRKRFDLNAIARRRRREAEQQTTAVAVAGSVVPWGSALFAFDEEAEGGRREYTVRLLREEGVIEVEDITEGWRTPGLARPDACRCSHCACIRALTVRGLRCHA